MAAQDDLLQQILGQGLTSKWSGEGLGGAEANAKEMARILDSIGITDIKQFGKVPKYAPISDYANTTKDYYKGRPVEYTEAGQPYVNLGDTGGEGPTIERITPEQVEKVRGQYDYGAEGGARFVPLDESKVVKKDGEEFLNLGTTFGNKLTGQAVPYTYGDRQSGDFFGGTFAGKGNTGYGVQFGPDGTPIFYTQGASSNDLANLMADLGPVGQIGLALATGGLSIPQQIAAQMAVQVLSGKDIGDAIKGAAVSLAVAQIPGTDFMKEVGVSIKDLGLDPAIAKTLNSAAQNAAMSATRAALTGQDIFDSALKGAAAGGVSGAVGEIVKGIPDFDKLTPTQQKMATNAITGVISGKPMDQILINSAIAAANAEIAEQKKYAPLSDDDLSYLTPEQRKVYDETGSKGLLEYNRSQKAAAASSEADLNALQKSGLNSSDTVTIIGEKGPDGYTDAERESKRIQDLIAVGGDPNAIDTVTIQAPRPQPDEHVFDPTYGGLLKPTVPNPNELIITGDRPSREFDFNNPTTTPVANPVVPTTTPTTTPPAAKPPSEAPSGPNIKIDPVQALQEFYNPFTPTPTSGKSIGSSQTDTGPIQLMTDVFGTNIASAQKTGARGYGFSAGGDIDELLRLLRS